MKSGIRRYYIDNLRWMILLVLIPYHSAMAWNVWKEPNYIFFEGNKALSGIVVFFSAFFMPLLFLLAGIGTKFALEKRTGREYLLERVKRLLVPFLFGTIALMPVMTYIADRFNCGYDGGFFRHYAVFFTKFTDLTGADGGFSMGQFWFLLYLLVISVVGVGIITLSKKFAGGQKKPLPFWAIPLLGLPLPLLSELLSIGGKSLAEYTYLFLVGYFVFSDETVVSKAEKHRWPLLGIGIAASVLNVYLFIWSGKDWGSLNSAAKYISEWFMVLALLGLAKKHLNFCGKFARYMSARSFLFYTWHFIWVVLSQYVLYGLVGNRTLILFAGSVLISYPLTFACCEICARIPLLRFVTGTKNPASNKGETK